MFVLPGAASPSRSPIRGRLVKHAFAAGALCVSACTCGEGDMLGVVEGQLLIAPSAIDFGATARGTEVVRTIRILNNGGTDVTIEDVAIRGSDAFSAPDLYPPLVFASGEEHSDEVIFRPATDSASLTATLVIRADDRDTPYEIALSGSSSQALLCVTPKWISFSKDAGEAQRCASRSTARPSPKFSGDRAPRTAAPAVIMSRPTDVTWRSSNATSR